MWPVPPSTRCKLPPLPVQRAPLTFTFRGNAASHAAVRAPPLVVPSTETQMTTDIKPFDIEKQPAAETQGRAAAVERSLHDLIERNLEVMLGIRFLAS